MGCGVAAGGFAGGPDRSIGQGGDSRDRGSDQGGGREILDPGMLAVSGDLADAADFVGENGNAAGHRFQGGVGHAFAFGRDHEQVHGLIPGNGILLQSGPDDPVAHGARVDLGEDPFLFLPVVAEEKKSETGIAGGGGFKTLDQEPMPFERREPRHISDPETPGSEPEPFTQGAPLVRRERMETLSVDAVPERELAGMSETEGSQLVELLRRDREHARGKAEKDLSLELPPPREFFAVEDDVFGMNEAGAKPAGQGAGQCDIDQAAEVVGVDKVEVTAPEDPPKFAHGRQAETGRFAERNDVHFRAEPFREGTGGTETADRDLEFRRVEPVADLNHDVLHSSLVQAVHDLEKPDFLPDVGRICHS